LVAYPTREGTFVRETTSQQVIAARETLHLPIAFSPDGGSLLLGSWVDSGIRIDLWNIEQGSVVEGATVPSWPWLSPYSKGLLGCWSTSGPIVVYNHVFLDLSVYRFLVSSGATEVLIGRGEDGIGTLLAFHPIARGCWLGCTTGIRAVTSISSTCSLERGPSWPTAFREAAAVPPPFRQTAGASLSTLPT
jgi:hypothetical protein